MEASIAPSRKRSGLSPASPRQRRAAVSIRQEASLGPQDAERIGVKLCRAGGPAARGGRRAPGAPLPLSLAARPPPPSPPALARHRLGPGPSLLPLAPRSLARSPAPPHSPARAQRSSARETAGLSARLPGGSGGCPGPQPPPSTPPFPPRSLPPCPAPAQSTRRAGSPRLRAPSSHDARGPAARRGTRRDLAAPRSAPGEPRGRAGGR